jgi:hypothetical protein
MSPVSGGTVDLLTTTSGPSLAFRRADSDDRVLGAGHRLAIRGGKCQPPRLDVALYQLAQSRLIKGDAAPLQLRDLLVVDVDDDHIVAEVGQARTCGQADVTRADDRDPGHSRPIISAAPLSQRRAPARRKDS